MSIGDKIRELREEKGISLSELAEKVDLPISCLEDVEKGRRRLGVQTLKRIAISLGVKADILVSADPGTGDDIEKETGEYISSSAGRRIRQCREEKGLTLVECGKRAGISYTHISEIERGNVCPSLKTLEKLAVALGKPASYFLAGNTPFGLGDKVRKLREAQGLTQARLAAQLGISDSLVAQIETGKAQPSLNTLEKLAETLGVSADYFLAQQDEYSKEQTPIVPLKKWSLGKKSENFLRLLQTFSERDLELVTDIVRLLRQYRGSQASNVSDPITLEIIGLVQELPGDKKQSVLDYIKFIASTQETEANA